MPAAATVDDSAVEEHLTAAHSQSSPSNGCHLCAKVDFHIASCPQLAELCHQGNGQACCALTHVDHEPETREGDRIRVAADCDGVPVSWLPSAANIGTTFEVCNVAMVDLSTILDNEFSAALGFANPVGLPVKLFF